MSGVVGPIVHADVESLYPSIMLNFEGTTPRSDHMEMTVPLLQALTDIRFHAKHKRGDFERGSNEYEEWDGRQSSYKIVINSMYGVLGATYTKWNDYGAADMVTSIGRDTVRAMAKYVTENGGKVIEVDTDGIYFVPPETVTGEDAERAFVKGMSETMPEGIRIGFDGRYKQMLSYKAKNYILEKYDGSRKVKGSSFRSRGMEPFGKRFIKEGFDAVMDGGIEGLRNLYMEYRRQIQAHEIPVEDLARKMTLSKTLGDYLEASRAPKGRKYAQFEVALWRRDNLGIPHGRGDSIQWFIGGTSDDLKRKSMYQLAKALDTYEQGDANVQHYLNRLDRFAEKFMPIFSGGDFRSIFTSDPTLFAVDYTAIETVTKDV